MIIIGICALIIFCIIQFILFSRWVKVKEKNVEIELTNQQLDKDNQRLKAENDEIFQKYAENNHSLTEKYSAFTKKIDQDMKEYEELEKAKSDQQLALYQDLCENKKKDFEKEVDQTRKKYDQEIAQLKIDADTKKSVYQAEVARMKSIVDAAVAADRRRQEAIEKENFYMIQLADWELNEIQALREVGKTLRNEEPLNKVIWKFYYEKKVTDLIGRVVGQGVHTGIYKITNVENNKCYVGQAVNLGDRWKQHIKRGLGADPVTNNKLYPAMHEIGPEKFKFEVIEECDKASLNEREDFWQEYFQAKEFGYSIK